MTFRQSTVTLTNAQVKLLKTTPITIVAAPGLNRVLVLVAAFVKVVAGAGAYVPNDAADYLVLLNGTLQVSSRIVVADLAPGADTYAGILTPAGHLGTVLTLDNQALTLSLTAAAQIGGGDATNSLSVTTLYVVVNAASPELE